MGPIRKLKLFFITAILVPYWSLQVKGQDPVFSQFNHYQLYFNPAFAGNSSYARMVAGYRNQWPGLNNSFVTYYISFDQYVSKISSNIGAAITRDVTGNGTFAKTSADFIYGYPIELSDQNILSLGIQASIVQKSLNNSGLVLPDQNPYAPSATTETITARSKIYPDFSTGAALYIRQQYMFGFSVHHLNTPNEMLGSGYTYISPMRFTIMGLANFSLSRSRWDVFQKYFQPGIMIELQNSFHQVNWGANFAYGPVSIGGWVRNNFSFHMNTFILQVGYENHGMGLIYSYDAWTPKNYQQVQFFGAHEVTFIYHFKYNDPKKKMRTIKCPKFSR